MGADMDQRLHALGDRVAVDVVPLDQVAVRRDRVIRRRRRRRLVGSTVGSVLVVVLVVVGVRGRFGPDPVATEPPSTAWHPCGSEGPLSMTSIDVQGSFPTPEAARDFVQKHPGSFIPATPDGLPWAVASTTPDRVEYVIEDSGRPIVILEVERLGDRWVPGPLTICG